MRSLHQYIPELPVDEPEPFDWDGWEDRQYDLADRYYDELETLDTKETTNDTSMPRR